MAAAKEERPSFRTVLDSDKGALQATGNMFFGTEGVVSLSETWPASRQELAPAAEEWQPTVSSNKQCLPNRATLAKGQGATRNHSRMTGRGRRGANPRLADLQPSGRALISLLMAQDGVETTGRDCTEKQQKPPRVFCTTAAGAGLRAPVRRQFDAYSTAATRVRQPCRGKHRASDGEIPSPLSPK